MAVERKPWGRRGETEIGRLIITNEAGASIVLSDFGATALQMNLPAPGGELADIVLGFDTVDDYRDTATYFGATVGRFANRIRRGRFMLDGVEHQVSCNEGQNSLHGGFDSYDKRRWNSEFDPSGNSVRFSLVSLDGDEGFPGTLRISSEYSLINDNVVRMEIRATTDRPTLCNIVHHSYFNLAGHASGTVLDQELQIHSDFYTPADDELVITGEVLRVADTPFDFRQHRPIGEQINKVPNAGAGRLGGDGIGGYDHNWCLRGEPGRLRPAMTVRDPASGRAFELFTTEPGVHFYTGGYLDASIVGKGGVPYRKFAGFTVETQKFPDAPNLGHVPQARLDPGEEYHHVVELRFVH